MLAKQLRRPTQVICQKINVIYIYKLQRAACLDGAITLHQKKNIQGIIHFRFKLKNHCITVAVYSCTKLTQLS